MNQDYFWHLLNVFCQVNNSNVQTMFDVLLDIWIDRLDNIVSPERRKLVGLAFASMITSDNTSIQQRFDSIISVCVEVLHDVCRLKDDDSCSQVDYFLMTDENPITCADDTEHEKRKRLASKRDPVFTVSMKDYTASQLTRCQQKHGDSNFSQIMSMIDSEITHQLKFLLR